jgi:hypothetical protein
VWSTEEKNLVGGFDHRLMDPTLAELDRALREAVKGVNGKRRHRVLLWPLADEREYRRLREQDVEGWRQWEGHWETARPEPSEVVWSAWWTDAAGRKHHRIVGQRAIPMAVGYCPLFSPATSGHPPLALVHPEGAVVRTIGGQRDVLVRCSCGRTGFPRSLGWMGTCCGHCHDRREAGEAVPESDRGGMAMAWSADLRTAAERGFDREGRHIVLIWDVHGNCERCRLDNDIFDHLALSPDGNFLATGGYVQVPPGGHALLWDLRRKEVRPLLGPTSGEIWALAFSPDGRTVAIAEWQCGVRLLDPATGSEKCLLKGYHGCRNGVAFSADGRLIASATETGKKPTLMDPALGYTVGIWDAATGELRQRISTHCYVPSVAFSPAGKLAIWAGANCEPDVHLWDVEAGRRYAVLPELHAAGQSVGFTRDGRFMACLIGRTNTIRVWDLDKGEEKCSLQWADFPPSGMAFIEAGLLVARTLGAKMDFWPVSLLGISP